MKKFNFLGLIASVVLFILLLSSSAHANTISEGFESGLFPPSGWTQVINNPNESWKQYTILPHTGGYAAQVLYDPALIPQDEWLLSPEITPISNFTVEAWSFGSLYYGRDIYDNYDLNLWLVYNTIGGGDDIFIGKLDDDWVSSYIWSQSIFDLAGLFTVGAPVHVGFQYSGLDGAQAALDDITIQWNPAEVPEPTTMLLLCSGLLGLWGARKKFRN